jgi:hypothetical protein
MKRRNLLIERPYFLLVAVFFFVAFFFTVFFLVVAFFFLHPQAIFGLLSGNYPLFFPRTKCGILDALLVDMLF